MKKPLEVSFTFTYEHLYELAEELVEGLLSEYNHTSFLLLGITQEQLIRDVVQMPQFRDIVQKAVKQAGFYFPEDSIWYMDMRRFDRTPEIRALVQTLEYLDQLVFD